MSEAAALADYLFGGYKNVNAALRNFALRTAELTELEFSGYVQALTSMLDRLPRSAAQTLTRILGDWSPDELQQFITAHAPGGIVTYQQFLSTSEPGGLYTVRMPQVKLTITPLPGVPNAARVGNLSRYEVEGEVLYKSGTRFRVGRLINGGWHNLSLHNGVAMIVVPGMLAVSEMPMLSAAQRQELLAIADDFESTSRDFDVLHATALRLAACARERGVTKNTSLPPQWREPLTPIIVG